MTFDEANAWLGRAPRWVNVNVHAAAGEARLDWSARRFNGREQLDADQMGGAHTVMLEHGPRIAADAAFEVAVVVAMWPLAPSFVLAGLRT